MANKPSASTVEVARALSFNPAEARPVTPDSRAWDMRFSTIKTALNRLAAAGLVAETTDGGQSRYHLTEAARAELFHADVHGDAPAADTAPETAQEPAAVPVAAARFGFDVGERVDARQVVAGDLVAIRETSGHLDYLVAARVLRVGMISELGGRQSANLWCAPICDAEGLPVPHLGDTVPVAGGWVMVAGTLEHTRVRRVTDVRPMAEAFRFGEDGRPEGGAGFIALGHTAAQDVEPGQCVLIPARHREPSFVQRVERVNTFTDAAGRTTAQLVGPAVCLADDGTPLTDSRIVNRVPEEGVALVVPVPDYNRLHRGGKGWGPGIWNRARMPIGGVREGQFVFIADAADPEMNGYAWRVDRVRRWTDSEDGRHVSLSLSRVCDRMGRESGRGAGFDYGKPEGWQVVQCRPIRASEFKAARQRG